MKRKSLIPAVLALAAASAALLGACKATDSAGNTSAAPGSANASRPASAQQPTGTTEVHGDGVRRVGPAELQQMVASGRAVVYDTRSRASYDQEHIKGALPMPFDEVGSHAGDLPRDKTLVFYCT